MARAGYCDACGDNVWLTPSGGCPRGHGPDHVSNAYETVVPGETSQAPGAGSGYVAPTGQPAGGQVPAPRKETSVGVILAIIAGVVLACVVFGALGFAALIGGPAFNAAKVSAQRKACFANERTIEGAAQAYNAENETMPESIQTLVPEFIKTMPTCPSGGTYTWDAATGRFTCSVHGHY